MLRRVLAFRPLLIIALMGGVFVFAPDVPTNNSQQITDNKGAAPLDANRNDAALSDDENVAFQDAPASIFETLFGKGAVDPLFKLPNGPIVGIDGQNLPEQAPQTEPQRSIYQYLVSASDIGFETDVSRLKLALATAQNGQTDALDGLIADLEARLQVFQALAAPEELRQIHEESNEIVLRYIQHLKNTRAQAPGGVESAWKAPERDAIGEEAQRITEQLRAIVHKHNISLPEGVLP